LNGLLFKTYNLVKEIYSKYNVNTDKVLNELIDIPISIHCWQGDDLIGFEKKSSKLDSGGILATGNYLGKPRRIDELRKDIEKAFSLIPGEKKLALHAIYGDFKDNVDRNKINPENFDSWIEWAKERNIYLDFNPTFFSHHYSEKGYTLSSFDKNIRKFWIDHLVKCREISNYIGEKLGKVCINNIWIPDGEKDITPSRTEHRRLLIDSLDESLSKIYPEKNMKDSLESKLFGIGSESFVVGSLEFYLSYAIKNDKFITLDTGHFHPTEKVSDKISAILPFAKGIVLHISRGVRWDSDHVPILSEELILIMSEIVRANALSKVYICTDFFDASINRIGAWVIGARAVVKALLYALIEPTELLKKYELENNNFARLALFEGLKTMPFGIIWHKYLESQNMPSDIEIINELNEYEEEVLKKR